MLAILRAVSTVPPRTTSFMPSIIDEPPPPPTRGWTSDLSASMMMLQYARWWQIQNCRYCRRRYGMREWWAWWGYEDKEGGRAAVSD